jgi:hypothetical protein
MFSVSLDHACDGGSRKSLLKGETSDKSQPSCSTIEVYMSTVIAWEI